MKSLILCVWDSMFCMNVWMFFHRAHSAWQQLHGYKNKLCITVTPDMHPLPLQLPTAWSTSQAGGGHKWHQEEWKEAFMGKNSTRAFNSHTPFTHQIYTYWLYWFLIDEFNNASIMLKTYLQKWVNKFAFGALVESMKSMRLLIQLHMCVSRVLNLAKPLLWHHQPSLL